MITIYEKNPTSSLFATSLCLPLASFALSRHLLALSLQASFAPSGLVFFLAHSAGVFFRRPEIFQ